MRLRNFRRKAVGIGLSAATVAGVGVMSYGGALPIHLADFASSNSQVQLPPASDAQVSAGDIFGLCTAYINHIAGTASTSTTSPSSTTTTVAPTTTTTAASTTTTSASTTTTSSTSASGSTSGSSSVQVPLVLQNAAKAKGETVLQLCVKVNPKHAQLKLFTSTGSGGSTTTTVAPTTTTTSASTTTTTSGSTSAASDDKVESSNASTHEKESETQQTSSDQNTSGTNQNQSSDHGTNELKLNAHFQAHAKVSGELG